MLAGCAAIPNTMPSQTPQDIGRYAAAHSFEAPAVEWPHDDWWRAYGDTQLDALIDEALANSPTLESAQARLAKAKSLEQEADAALLPRLSANASVKKTKQSYNEGVPAAYVPQGYQTLGRATVDLSYELDFFGRNRAALAAATSEAEAARADAALARLSLSTSVAEAYAELAQLYADCDAANEAVRIRERSSALTTDRFAQGLENRGAVEQAAAAAASAREQRTALDESIALVRNKLASLLGAGPDRGMSVQRPDIRNLAAFGLPEDLRANLVGRRPDIVAARLRAEAAGQRIKQVRASFYPNINLSAYIGQESLGLDLLTRAGSQIGAVGPALSLPIFEGGRLRAAYRGANADYDGAVAEYNATIVQALWDVADAAVSLRALDARLLESQKALDAAKRAYDIALQRYQGGVATYLDVLTAEDALVGNQRTHADLRARAFSLNVALVRALGGGFVAG
jgi:NodT family efflux transporter outer membrane factor (OMF) lipoprotein